MKMALSLPKKKNKKKADFHILTILAAGKKSLTLASMYITFKARKSGMEHLSPFIAFKIYVKGFFADT